jgi:hypothetical protein
MPDRVRFHNLYDAAHAVANAAIAEGLREVEIRLKRL